MRVKFGIVNYTLALLLWSSLCKAQSATHAPTQPSTSGANFTAQGDVFGTRVFVENKGQFDSYAFSPQHIEYALENGEEKIYFTKQGIVYLLKEDKPLSERQMECFGKSGKPPVIKSKTAIVLATWQNANASVQIQSSEKQSHYITYGEASLNSSTYKKITYKNLYPFVDVEYMIPEDKSEGIKYTLILHPGAKAADVQLAYSGDVQSMGLNANREVKIKTKVRTITEHSPISYHDNGAGVNTQFTLNNNCISFAFPNGYDLQKTLIIDPWVSTAAGLTSNSLAYDVDDDVLGNAYIYGGTNPWKVAKYNATGTLLWVFSGSVTSTGWVSGIGNGSSGWSANMAVNKTSGKTYVGTDYSPNAVVVRLDANGNYDNFVSTGSGQVVEVSDLGFDCATGKLMVFAGAATTGGSASMQLVDPVTSTVSPFTRFIPTLSASNLQDIVCWAEDDAGNLFVNYGVTSVGNKICAVSPSFTNNLWLQPTGYSTMNELSNKIYIGAGSISALSYNCLAVNSSYLYYYDGRNLAAYNKSTGAMLASTSISSLTAKYQGGIAVDECNNIYVGGNGSVLTFSFNGTSFTGLFPISINISTPPYVFDIHLNKLTNVLYVSGSNFVGTYTVPSCSVVNYCSCLPPQVAVNTSSNQCYNLGASTVTPLGMTGPFSYTWLPGGQNTPTVTNLAPGSYSVIVYSSSCNKTASAVTTFSAFPPTYSLSALSTSITCASLGSATAAILNMPGPFSYTWLPVNQTGSVASGLNPGTYTLNVYSNTCGIGFSTTTVFTSLIPLSGTLNNTNSLTCNGMSTGTAAYTNLAGGSGNQSYVWTNGTSSYTVPNPNSLTAGVWNVTVTDALTGCTINDVFLILQPPALTLNIASSTPSACVGYSIGLTSIVSGGTPGYAYNWSAGPVTSSLALAMGTGGTYANTLTVTDANNCSLSNTISVDFVNNPVLTVSHASVCPLETGTITVSGAGSYTWSNASNSAAISDNPTVTTTYSVTGQALGCSSSTTSYIFVKPLPTPLIVSNSPVCHGKNLLLSCSTGTAFAWAGPAGFNSSNSSNTISSVNMNTHAGLYQLTVTAANSCTAATSLSVSIKPLPTLTLSAPQLSLCAGSTSVNLNASGTATQFTWMPSGGLSSANIANPVAAPTANQSYTLIGALNGCTSVATTTVYVVPTPVLNINLSSSSLCAQALNGSPNTITLKPGGTTSYTLVTPNHIYNPNPSGPNSPLSVLPPYNPTGPATATLYGSNGVCVVTATAAFVVVPNPTISINSYTPVICAGQSFTYTNSGASSYTWSSATPGSSVYSTGNVAVANPSINSVFSVFGGSLGCNSALQTSTITVNPLPIVSIAPNPTYICKGRPINLQAQGNAGSYVWQPINGLSGNTGSVVSANPSTLTNYTVIGTLNNCSNTAMATVSVMALPQVSITADKTKLCVNDNINLQGFGAEYYHWDLPGSVQLNGQNVNFKPNSLNYTGNFTLTGTDKNFCSGKSTVFIHIDDLPNGYLNARKFSGCVPFCSDFTFIPNVINSSSISQQSWTFNGQTGTLSSFYTCYTTAGTYTIRGAIKDNNDCVNTFSYEVNVYPQPKADYTFLPEHPVESFDEVLFTNTSLGNNIKAFNWYFINNEGFKASSENTAYLFQNEGLYPVALVVKTEEGCSDTIVKHIKVEPDFNFFVPNTFTPNNDNKNDLFMPVMRGVKTYTFSIYNRWGQKLFETSDPQQSWNGTFNGNECKQDVYVWKAELSTLSGELKEYTGHVTLYR